MGKGRLSDGEDDPKTHRGGGGSRRGHGMDRGGWEVSKVTGKWGGFGRREGEDSGAMGRERG